MRTILYHTYNFRDKDPVIDLLRTRIKDQGLSYWEIQKISGVPASCLWNWMEGETKRPSHAAVAAVAIALGMTELPLTEKRSRTKSRARHTPIHLRGGPNLRIVA